MSNNEIIKTDLQLNQLYKKVSNHIHAAREAVVRSVNIEQVKAYWLIGRDIVEEEQAGKERADYGKNLLNQLSAKLQKEFGKGFGVSTLTHARRFYLAYQELQKSYALRTKSDAPEFKTNLGWTHYRSLMQVNDVNARKFYEIEASKNNWSSRELERQIGSLLYQRLALSKDKKGLLALVNKGQEIQTPEDAIKDPYVLEFLDLPESHQLIESKVEQALITNLKDFLLEMGRGFSFVARQQRLTLDGDHFYVDLVFYNFLLKRFVLIDIKTTAVTHEDLGQMRLYRNYYDMECLSESDNPTIGLILCTKKNYKMVKYFLKDDDAIFASKYRFTLPTEEELKIELQKEMKKLNMDTEASKNDK